MHTHPTKKKPTAVNESEELKDKIRQRAYQLYEERLWEDGHELDDWLRGRRDRGAGGPSQGRLILVHKFESAWSLGRRFFIPLSG